MRFTIFAIALATLVGCVSKKPVSVGIVNQSKWGISHLYLSPKNENTWGSDQLGDNTVVASGESLLLEKIPSGIYDAKLVDEDGDTCIVPDVAVDSDHEVVLTDEMLLRCEVETKEAGLE